VYPKVISVRANEDFSLDVAFDDGVAGVLDVKPYLGFGIFRKLNDRAQFRQVRVAFDTVEWQCGADLDPEFVRAKCRIVDKARNPDNAR
jgi:hypothetical protein